MIENLINPESVLFELSGGERDEVLAEMTENLVSQNSALNRNDVFKALVAREEKMTTAFESKIAVPHAVSKTISKTVISLGISHNGVDFDLSSDSTKDAVNVIFCIVFPENKADEHLDVLKDILNLSQADDFVQHVLSCKNQRDVCDLIYNFFS